MHVVGMHAGEDLPARTKSPCLTRTRSMRPEVIAPTRHLPLSARAISPGTRIMSGVTLPHLNDFALESSPLVLIRE